MIGALLSNRYEVTQELESEPVFTSFRAKDRLNGRDVTIRVIAKEVAKEPDFLPELKATIDRSSGFQQTGLERVFGLESDATNSFLVSEALGGASLDDRLKRLANFSVPVAVSTIIEVCSAIQPLHQAGIIHGDISARTVFSTPTDGVKVTMVGFWQAYAQSPRAAVGMLRVMAPYLAPEISAGEMPTPASDVYAMGVLLWQLLTGRVPYQGDTPASSALKHQSSPYPSLRNVTASVPVVLDEIVKKSMDKNPLGRYPNAGAMLGDLRLLLDGLRFGRALTWPLQALENTANQPVAPTLNAIKTVPRPKISVHPREEGDGVPVAVKFFTYVAAMALLAGFAGWTSYNLRRPKALQVPNLIGKPETQARQALEKIGVKMRIAKRVSSDKYGEGVVLQMSPAPGEDVRSHTRVEVVLSSGSAYVLLPDLRNKTVDDARKLLETIGLAASDDLEYVRDENVPDGKVAGQTPDPKTKVARFSKVRLRVSSSAASIANDSKPDPATGLHRYSLKFRMPKSSVDTRVKIEITDSHETRTFMDENRSSRERVTATTFGYGESVIFKIYFDDILVKTQKVLAEGKVGQ